MKMPFYSTSEIMVNEIRTKEISIENNYLLFKCYIQNKNAFKFKIMLMSMRRFYEIIDNYDVGYFDHIDVVDYCILKCTKHTLKYIMGYDYLERDALLYHIGYIMSEHDYEIFNKLHCYKIYNRDEVCVWKDNADCIDWSDRLSTLEQLDDYAYKG